MLTTFCVWPVTCYAARATSEKICADRFPAFALKSSAVASLATFAMTIVTLLATIRARYVMDRPMIWMEHTYVGMALMQSSFFTCARPDWDRLGIVAFIYACSVYAWSDSSLLTYAVVFAFFRSLHNAKLSAQETFAMEFPYSFRYVEIALLASICARSAWMTGAVDPVMLSLNFITAYAHRYSEFIRK